jgi:hypothetical protein
MPRPFQGFSLQSFPLARDRLPLSRQPGSLAVIHQRAGTHSPRPCCRRFHPLPRFHAVARIPRRLWAPFRRTGVHLPLTLGLTPQNRTVPSASPASKLLSLPRVRSRLAWVSPPQPVDTLLGFAPSRAFSPRLGFSTRPDTRPEHMPFVQRLWARDSKDRITLRAG